MTGAQGEGTADKTLPRKQEAAIMALLSESTLQLAATAAGISESTLRRLLRDEHFAAAYREARRQAFGQAIGQLQHGARKAVATLLRVCDDVGAPAHAQVAAARAVLEMGQKWIETEEMEARLAAIEARLAQEGDRSGAA